MSRAPAPRRRPCTLVLGVLLFNFRQQNHLIESNNKPTTNMCAWVLHRVCRHGQWLEQPRRGGGGEGQRSGHGAKAGTGASWHICSGRNTRRCVGTRRGCSARRRRRRVRRRGHFAVGAHLGFVAGDARGQQRRVHG